VSDIKKAGPDRETSFFRLSAKHKKGETQKMAIFTTSNGRDYKFSFERRLDGSIRPYIVSQPSYGLRSDEASETHRAQDREDERWYVPWDEPLYTVAEAKEAAAAWAKRTDVYLDKGVWIPYEKTNQQLLPYDDPSVPQVSRREAL
jgi:hypothetical protein